MKSSKEIRPFTKNEARILAKNIWKNFISSESQKNSLIENLILYVSKLKRDTRILAFIALPDEIDIMSALEKFPFRVYVPRFDNAENMEFALYLDSGKKKSVLRKGPHGIWIPEQNSEILKLPLDGADVLFVPSLASNENGSRLGRGGGYYDRWKERFTGSRIMGILPSELVSLNFPAENHDIKFHGVITEKGIVEYK